MDKIYIRTSTGEQTPELQLRDIQTIISKDVFDEIIFNKIYTDKQSAFKDNKERAEFELLKKEIFKGLVNNLYVWDLDRLYRKRKKLIEFFAFCKNYNCKVHSFNQQWLNNLNTIQPPFNEIMFDLMLQIMGWLAEEESVKKSNRVKMSVNKKDGITISHKGNKWGRKQISQIAVSKVLLLRKENPNISLREIAKQILITDKNNNMKNISKSVVHKILTENLGKNIIVNDGFLIETIKGQENNG